LRLERLVLTRQIEDSLDEAAHKLSLLHKQSIRKGELDSFWEKTIALCAGSVGKVLFSESVLRLIRREIRRDTGLLIDTEDLAKSIHEMLCTEAREEIGPMRIRKRRRFTRKSSSDKVSESSPTEPMTESKDEEPGSQET